MGLLDRLKDAVAGAADAVADAAEGVGGKVRVGVETLKGRAEKFMSLHSIISVDARAQMANVLRQSAHAPDGSRLRMDEALAIVNRMIQAADTPDDSGGGGVEA